MLAIQLIVVYKNSCHGGLSVLKIRAMITRQNEATARTQVMLQGAQSSFANGTSSSGTQKSFKLTALRQSRRLMQARYGG